MESIITLKHFVTLFTEHRKTQKKRGDRQESNRVHHLQSVRRVENLPAYWVKAAAAPSSSTLLGNRHKMIVRNRMAPTRMYITRQYQQCRKFSGT